jgi:peptidyl-prolyl cis-trans isomerase B (cyclophilin B)
MKLFFALAFAGLIVGCSPAPTDTGSGSSAPSTTGSSSAALVKQPHADPAPPDPTPIADRKPKDGDEVAVMDTSLGRIVLMFFPDKAPNHVVNFKYLAGKGFYDGTKFHRIIPTFMIQGGDPNTKSGDPNTWGGGGPGYTLEAEFNDVKHVPGILSMARTNDVNGAGSQFFIMVAPTPSLDGQYSAFGKVVSGMDVVDKIKSVPTGEQDRPNDPPIIKSLKIEKWPVK